MNLRFRSVTAQSALYRPDIDGLRALAVLPVVFYHAGVPGFGGGFVGVDVFFVISGFLITSVIQRSIDQGGFSYATFYERRFRRIFPALFVLLLVTTAVSAIFFEPHDFEKLGESVLAMSLFVSNVFLWRSGGPSGYFDNGAATTPLLHTWSLSVEEQFYILFPPALALLNRFFRKRTVAVVAAVGFASFLLSVWGVSHKPQATFYLMPTRAWELFLGALLALGAFPPLNCRLARELLAAVGLGLLSFAVIAFDKSTPFPGPSALLPCLGAFAILYAGAHGGSVINSLLGRQPLLFVGVISYSLYLWHWPVLVMFRYVLAAGHLGAVATGVALATSSVLAVLSFELVESPFRQASFLGRRRVLALAFAASATAAAVGLGIVVDAGVAERFSAPTRDLLALNYARKSDWREECGNWKVSAMTYCEIGPLDKKRLMFWGDSHIQQLWPLVEKMYADGRLGGHGVVFAASPGCPVGEDMNRSEEGYHCGRLAQLSLARAESADVDTVVIGFSAYGAAFDSALCLAHNDVCYSSLSPSRAVQQEIEELQSNIRQLKLKGKKVIVLLPLPVYNKSIPDMEIHNAIFAQWGLQESPADRISPSLVARSASAATAAGAEVYDLRQSLCRPNCFQIAGVSVYKDTSHLAASQLWRLEDGLGSALRGSGQAP
jgi:peptidoglycan/LPS O-acetylase OafA/YrhL